METQEYNRLRAVEDDHWWFRALHELVVAVLGSRLVSTDSRILDAGCGTGGLLAKLAALGRVEGIDASELAVALATTRGLQAVRRDDLNEPSLAPAAYDAVTSLDVLYHTGIVDETVVLRHLHATLRPGGLLFLHLPAFESLRSAHDRRVHTRRRYRLPAVRRMLAGAGFEIMHASYRMTALAPPVLLVRGVRSLWRRDDTQAPSDVDLPPRWLNRLLLAVCRLENRLSLRVPLPAGISLYVVARRPPGQCATRS